MGTFRHPFLTPVTPLMPLCSTSGQENIESLPITPPELGGPVNLTVRPEINAVKSALHVIATERKALEHLELLYSSNDFAQGSLANSVNLITEVLRNHGKVIISGVGKSGKIGEKLVATFNSLGIQSCFLHPTEALHGDLGVIKPNDTILMISFSGRTSELLHLLPHIKPCIPLIVLTSHLVASTCPIFSLHPNSILLPAPTHEPEQVSLGISAPTSSTTVALALGDSLAIAVAETLHTAPGQSPADVFHSHHPGGAIGAAAAAAAGIYSSPLPKMADLATLVSEIPVATPTTGHPDSHLTTLNILLTTIQNPQAKGWVRVSPIHIIGPRRIRTLLTDHPDRGLHEIPPPPPDHAPLVIEKPDWISVLGSCSVTECRAWILRMRREERGRGFLRPGTVLGVVDDRNEVSAVVEIEDVVGDDLSGTVVV